MNFRSLTNLTLLSIIVCSISACNAQPEAERESESEPKKVKTNDADSTDKAFVGLSKEQASELAKDRGLRFRVIKEDGKNMFGTKDFRQDRVNATVENGKVIATKRG